jgi:hypothetical protein
MMAVSYASLDKEQKHTLNNIVNYGQGIHASPRAILAAIATGLVEDNLKNENKGSGTSVGWRQEISSKGTVAERLDLSKSIPKFYKEVQAAEKSHPTATAGELAQMAQGSEYPHRYSEHELEAEKLRIEVIGNHEALQEPLFGVFTGKGVEGAEQGGEEAVEKGVEAVTASAKVLAIIGEWIGDPTRLGKLIAGGALLYMGLHSLTAGTAAEGAVEAPAKLAKKLGGAAVGVATDGGSTAAKKAMKLKKKTTKAPAKAAAKKPAKTTAKGSKMKPMRQPSNTSSTGKPKGGK